MGYIYRLELEISLNTDITYSLSVSRAPLSSSPKMQVFSAKSQLMAQSLLTLISTIKYLVMENLSVF